MKNTVIIVALFALVGCSKELSTPKTAEIEQKNGVKSTTVSLYRNYAFVAFCSMVVNPKRGALSVYEPTAKITFNGYTRYNYNKELRIPVVVNVPLDGALYHLKTDNIGCATKIYKAGVQLLNTGSLSAISDFNDIYVVVQ